MAERLTRLEEDCDTQRARWIAAAAQTAGLHRPADAVKLVDLDQVVTSRDADRAVEGLSSSFLPRAGADHRGRAPVHCHRTVARKHFTHYSLLHTTEPLLGLGHLGRAAGAHGLSKAFHL
jgi:hypothetical protein